MFACPSSSELSVKFDCTENVIRATTSLYAGSMLYKGRLQIELHLESELLNA